MHRLFWKLFLSFWATLILFSVAVMLSVSIYIDHLHGQQTPTGGIERISEYQAQAQAQAKADAKGIQGLQSWAQNVDRKNLVPVLVLDAT
ncbi:MAG: two-component sensor histidine kinase, partial [Sulfuriferula sp.]